MHPQDVGPASQDRENDNPDGIGHGDAPDVLRPAGLGVDDLSRHRFSVLDCVLGGVVDLGDRNGAEKLADRHEAVAGGPKAFHHPG